VAAGATRYFVAVAIAVVPAALAVVAVAVPAAAVDVAAVVLVVGHVGVANAKRIVAKLVDKYIVHD